MIDLIWLAWFGLVCCRSATLFSFHQQQSPINFIQIKKVWFDLLMKWIALLIEERKEICCAICSFICWFWFVFHSHCRQNKSNKLKENSSTFPLRLTKDKEKMGYGRRPSTANELHFMKVNFPSISSFLLVLLFFAAGKKSRRELVCL